MSEFRTLLASIALLTGTAFAESPVIVQPGPFTVEVSYPGTFAAMEAVPVSVVPEIWSSFEVVEAVAHGERVEKGATLVRFDATDLEEKIHDLEHEASMAVLSLERARAELQIVERSIEVDLSASARAKRIADADLERYRSRERALAVRSAEESLKASTYSLEYAEEELDQLQKMYEADDLTEETEEIVLKRQRRSVEAAKFRLERAQESTEETLSETIPLREEELADRAERAEIAHAKATLTSPLELEKKRLEVAALERKWQRTVEQLARHRSDLALLVVPAPATGVVYYGRVSAGKVADARAIEEKQLRQGGKVSAREVFMTIVPEGPLRVVARIEEKLLADLHEGITGLARPTAFPDRQLPVRLGAVLLVPIASGEFDCPASVEDGANTAHIVPGMTCKVDCVVYEREDALTVPAKAVRGTGDDRYVLVKGAGEHEKRPVQVGRTSDGKTEILHGLSAGDAVVVSE